MAFDSLFVNASLYKLFGGHVYTEAIHLSGLELALWMDGELFNFSDLIPAEDSLGQNPDTLDESSFIDQFTFNDIQLRSGSVSYEDKQIQVVHNMEDINIKLPGISIGDERTNAGLEFAFADGGKFRTQLDYDLQENQYIWELDIEQLNLQQFTSYAQESMHISDMQGRFSGSVTVSGDIDEPYTPIISGNMELNDFALIDTNKIKALGFNSIYMDAIELNAGTERYHFGSLEVNKPYLHAIIQAESNNLLGLSKESEVAVDSSSALENDSISNSVLTYLLDEFHLRNGIIQIDDQSLKSGAFHYEISKLNLSAQDFTEGKMVQFDMDALMNGKGNFKGKIYTDPGNPGNGTFDFYLKNVATADFSAYCEEQTAYPISSGIMSFQTENKIEKT